MGKKLSKSIMNRLRYKHRYLKRRPRENLLAYENAKNLCNSFNKKAELTNLSKLQRMDSCVV